MSSWSATPDYDERYRNLPDVCIVRLGPRGKTKIESLTGDFRLFFGVDSPAIIDTFHERYRLESPTHATTEHSEVSMEFLRPSPKSRRGQCFPDSMKFFLTPPF